MATHDNPRVLRILIGHPHMIVRVGLKQVLAEEYRSVVFGEAHTAVQTLAQIERHQWDIAILDASNWDKDRFSTLQETLHRRTSLRILTLRTDQDSACAACVLRVCTNCISVSVSRSALVKAFKTAIAGNTYVEQIFARMPPASSPLAIKKARLSPRESKVLLELAAGKRTGEIASEWNLSFKTISTYKRRALEKLELKSTADLVRYVIHERLA